MEKLLSPEEVEEMLSVKRSTIYKWTFEGSIPHLKLGRLLRFREADLREWLKDKERDGRA